MNFGERLKQLRTEKGLTQPQFAQAAGIEQSYLSKLENDKSVPSAEMFSTILAGLGVNEAGFLHAVDPEVMATGLRHIPAVAQFTSQAATTQVNHSRQWLLGSALAWILGFAMMLAANDGIFFSNKLYKYTSPGVILSGEPEDIFQTREEILSLRHQAGILSREDMLKEVSEFRANRMRPVTAEWADSRGTVYVEAADTGRRRFDLVHTEHVQAPGNRILQFLGAVVIVCGFAGLFIEWRLRRLKHKRFP